MIPGKPGHAPFSFETHISVLWLYVPKRMLGTMFAVDWTQEFLFLDSVQVTGMTQRGTWRTVFLLSSALAPKPALERQ